MSEYKKLLQDLHWLDEDKSNAKDKSMNVVVERTVSPSVKGSSYYNNLSPMEQLNMERYIDKKINIYDGYIGKNKSDAIANGIELPHKYINERIIYDRNSKAIKMSGRMVEMVKRQVGSMKGYKLSRMYETKRSYRLVFESDDDGHFEITVRELK